MSRHTLPKSIIHAVLTAHTIVLVCYAWLVFMQLTRDLFAIAKFLLAIAEI